MASEMLMEEPMCLIQNSTSGALQVNSQAVKILEGITQPVVVVAIVGMYRTGKSYLMNSLAGKRKGFSLGSTIQSHTKGIWMWCVPHPGKPDHTLVLLDTEGLGDVEKGDPKHDTWIFTLAVLLSSTLVYNSKGTIDQDSMNKLHFVSELSEHIKVKADGEEEEDSALDTEYISFFPNFTWTVRDFTLDLEIDGKEVTEDEYLERALMLRKGRNREVMEYNLPRQCIRDYFPTRKCFVFIRPASERDMKQLESLPDSALQPEFLEQLDKFCQYVLRESKVKMLKGGHHINGRMFGMLAQSYVDTIISGKVPCLENAVTTLATKENEAAIKEGLAYYVAQMEEQVVFPVEVAVLSEIHGNCEKAALQLFMQRSFKDEDQKHQEQLAIEINEHYGTVLSKNKSTSQETCQTLLTQLSADMEKKLRNGVYMQPGGHELYMKDQKQVLESFQRTPNKGVMAEQVLEQFMDSKKAEAATIVTADKMLTDVQKSLAAERARVEQLEQQRKAEEERRQQLEQRMRDVERSHQENIRQVEAKMEEEAAKMRQEMDRTVECKLKEQEKLLQQGFTEQARVLQEEMDRQQKQGKAREEKMQQQLREREEKEKQRQHEREEKEKQRQHEERQREREEKEKQRQHEKEENEKQRQHEERQREREEKEKQHQREREEKEKQRQREREEKEKQRQHEERQREIEEKEKQCQREREEKEKQRQHEERQREIEEKEKQRQHEKEENEKQRQHEERQQEREEKEKQRQYEERQREREEKEKQRQREREEKEKQRQHEERQREIEEKEKQRQHEKEENEKQRQHEERQREIEEKEKQCQREIEEKEKQRQQEREEKEKQRQYEERQREIEEKEKQRQHERKEKEKQRLHEIEEKEKQRLHEIEEKEKQRQHEKEENEKKQQSSCLIS
ncbi:guanylate-binding protein 1-like [Mauremys mutica]|uniref:guanylate-binding protein 1-like n=1 Tax=Mauremys mutica TaxID=74926 RepID=UPI001D16A1FE|nr:guanylate-binding protein 1-like [Mauremys mutica]